MANLLAALSIVRQDAKSLPRRTALNEDLTPWDIAHLAAMVADGLLPEQTRVKIVGQLRESALLWLELVPLVNPTVASIFTGEEFCSLIVQCKSEWFDDLQDLHERIDCTYASEDKLALFIEIRQNLHVAKDLFYPGRTPRGWPAFVVQIDCKIFKLIEDRFAPEGICADGGAGRNKVVSALFQSARMSATSRFDELFEPFPACQ